MRLSGELISRIEKLPEDSLIELEKYVDRLIENHRIKTLKNTRNQLEKLKTKPNFEDIDIELVPKPILYSHQ